MHTGDLGGLSSCRDPLGQLLYQVRGIAKSELGWISKVAVHNGKAHRISKHINQRPRGLTVIIGPVIYVPSLPAGILSVNYCTRSDESPGSRDENIPNLWKVSDNTYLMRSKCVAIVLHS
ncbi:hypothetical protein J6590_003967 [Homalodisca vitripennis]|nr:hypothetical protein J6590_003967 [Homalodisca vitripennis]